VARPTKSRALYAQMLGRGTRPLPRLVDALPTPAERTAAIRLSAKPNLFVLDFTGNPSRHKLVTPADVLGGKYPDEDRDAASKLLESEEETDVSEALERARREREEKGGLQERAVYAGSRARIVALAKYLLEEVDLFDGAFAPGRERVWLTGKAPTEPQIATLERAGFKREDIERMNKNECSRLIGEIIVRRQRGLCTLKQARLLASFGVDAKAMTFEEAGAAITRRIGNRRG